MSLVLAFQTNNFQLVIIWDSCVSFVVFSYNSIQWLTGHQGDADIAAVWDGAGPQEVTISPTASSAPIVMDLTSQCSGALLSGRQCRESVSALPAVMPFENVRCPALLFGFRFVPFRTVFRGGRNSVCFFRQSPFQPYGVVSLLLWGLMRLQSPTHRSGRCANVKYLYPPLPHCTSKTVSIPEGMAGDLASGQT